MSEIELNRRAILAILPLGIAFLGVVGMTVLLGTESINLAAHLTNAKSVAEATTIITNSINPVMIFGGLKMAVDYANETATIFAAGAGPSLALMWVLMPRKG